MNILMLFMAMAFGQPIDDTLIVSAKRSDYQVVQIYVDISEVHAPDGSIGTSKALNILISHYAQSPQLLKRKLQYWSNPHKWSGEINIYDWHNVKYMPTFSSCDYSDALGCGVKNSHWTLRTVVLVGEKYSTLTMKLYDEKGRQISKGSWTAWGKIRWKPQWKLTTVKEEGPFGGGSKEIFEMWPPEMEELPPLIKPMHVRQARFGVFEVNHTACRLKFCQKR